MLPCSAALAAGRQHPEAPQRRGDILKAGGKGSVLFVPSTDVLAMAFVPPSSGRRALRSRRVEVLVGTGEKLEATLAGSHDLDGRTFAELPIGNLTTGHEGAFVA
jgi:hypothetical protein